MTKCSVDKMVLTFIISLTFASIQNEEKLTHPHSNALIFSFMYFHLMFADGILCHDFPEMFFRYLIVLCHIGFMSHTSWVRHCHRPLSSSSQV